MLVVSKFGGSSLANATQFAKVKKIIDNDSLRKVVVVSAIGKEDKTDNKITDLNIEDTVIDWSINENNEIIIKPRKKVSLDDVLDWSTEDGKMIIEIKRQRPISDLSKFVIKGTGPTNAVELKKKAGRGEL